MNARTYTEDELWQRVTERAPVFAARLAERCREEVPVHGHLQADGSILFDPAPLLEFFVREALAALLNTLFDPDYEVRSPDSK